MAFDYAKLRDNTVEPLIKRFGKAATLLAPGPATSGQPAWNPETGEPVEHPVYLVKTKVDIKDTQGTPTREGTLVQMTDEAYIMSTEGVTIDPNLKYAIIVDGVKLQVIQIKPLKPGPVTMLWKVFARK